MPTRGRSRSTYGKRVISAARKVTWIGSVIAPTSLAAGAQSFTELFTNFRPQTRKGLTLLRIRGTLRVNSTDAALSADFATGFLRFREGATFFPRPETDTQEPWLWWKATSALPSEGQSNFFDLDIKAKRVMRSDDDEIGFMMENTDSAQTLSFALGIRALWALP